jgi:arylsulfatase A-like enzyme
LPISIAGYIGKWHLAGVPRDQAVPAQRRLGFHTWKVRNCNHEYLHSYYHDEENHRHDIRGYDAETHTDLAVDFIHGNRGNLWGLWLSWGPPHDPYTQAPRQFLDLYEGRRLALRANVPAHGNSACGRQPQAEVEQDLRGYYAHIAALDQQFARLLAALEQTGQRDNTIIVYTSDHGDMLGSHGWTGKQLPFDESIRVPLLLQWPGIIRQGVCHASRIDQFDGPAGQPARARRAATARRRWRRPASALHRWRRVRRGCLLHL